MFSFASHSGGRHDACHLVVHIISGSGLIVWCLLYMHALNCVRSSSSPVTSLSVHHHAFVCQGVQGHAGVAHSDIQPRASKETHTHTHTHTHTQGPISHTNIYAAQFLYVVPSTYITHTTSACTCKPRATDVNASIYNCDNMNV